MGVALFNVGAFSVKAPDLSVRAICSASGSGPLLRVAPVLRYCLRVCAVLVTGIDGS
jgi:hypothetical protein